jgi:putative NIF3 family GTP cyclohydrolase 1 type 2
LEARAVTAGDIVDRVKKHLGAAWNDASYRDTFKAGGRDTPVRGVATTVFASFDMIQRAVGAGLNMIIPHEDTFWNDRDDVSVVVADRVYARKRDFLARHDVVIFRIHDHMHAQRPDFTYLGSARELGLDPQRETSPGSHRFTVPETTLSALAASLQRRVGARALRVVGDPDAKVSRIQLGVGYATPAVNDPEIDVVISGEQQEVDGSFDSPAYALDASAVGIAKGWIMLGHAVSEEAGMLEMAQWIGSFVPEVPVVLVKAGEPFWAPQ